jgi:Zn-dependent metalloprotease
MLRHDSDFAAAARLTQTAAADLYGKGSLEEKAVREAWSAVGLPS